MRDENRAGCRPGLSLGQSGRFRASTTRNPRCSSCGRGRADCAAPSGTPNRCSPAAAAVDVPRAVRRTRRISYRPAGRVSVDQSQHHSHTFPCMSYMPTDSAHNCPPAWFGPAGCRLDCARCRPRNRIPLCVEIRQSGSQCRTIVKRCRSARRQAYSHSASVGKR